MGMAYLNHYHCIVVKYNIIYLFVQVTEEVLGEDGALSVSEHEVTDALAVHVYKVHVFTADKRRAGTDANVFINLIGENGDSGERPLAVSETHRDKFERGQVHSTLPLSVN